MRQASGQHLWAVLAPWFPLHPEGCLALESEHTAQQRPAWPAQQGGSTVGRTALLPPWRWVMRTKLQGYEGPGNEPRKAETQNIQQLSVSMGRPHRQTERQTDTHTHTHPKEFTLN